VGFILKEVSQNG